MAAPFNDKDTFTQRVISFLLPAAEERALVESEAEKAAGRARWLEYDRHCLQEHMAWQATISGRLALRMAALRALPPELQEHARQPDLTPLPPARNVYFDAPPTAYLSGR